MKPCAFEYHRPDSVEEALALLARYGDEAKLLAGGQSLIPTMNFRLAQPAVLIDLNRLNELAYLEPANGAGLRIGAMTRQSGAERSAEVTRSAPLIREALLHVAHPQIRNRATVGGSLAHADPAAELPAVAVALDAQLVVRNASGTRAVAADEFFTGLFATALQPDDLLTEIRFPAPPPGAGWAFGEIARRHGDYALAGVAATVALDDRGACGSARLVLFSVGDRPVRAARAEAALLGGPPSVAAFREAAHAAAHTDIEPHGDIHASAAYRRQLVEVLLRRLLPVAFERARTLTPALLVPRAAPPLPQAGKGTGW
jgi:aerobic carbon-monoxide dehydrogenase medium subunit